MNCDSPWSRITQFKSINVCSITVNGVPLTPGGGGLTPDEDGVVNYTGTLTFNATNGLYLVVDDYSGPILGMEGTSITLQSPNGNILQAANEFVRAQLNSGETLALEAGDTPRVYGSGEVDLTPQTPQSLVPLLVLDGRLSAAQRAAINALTGSSTAADIVAALQAV